MQKVRVLLWFFFSHFNNDVQRCCKTIRMLIAFFVLVAKRLELQPTQLQNIIFSTQLSLPNPKA